jgi:hypothetical protein
LPKLLCKVISLSLLGGIIQHRLYPLVVILLEVELRYDYVSGQFLQLERGGKFSILIVDQAIGKKAGGRRHTAYKQQLKGTLADAAAQWKIGKGSALGGRTTGRRH